jgi:N-acetylmuramoyl-L-alanine amidase
MEKSVELATLIQKQFKTTAKRIDKGVHQAGFLVLRETSMPGVLVELGYISTPDEEKYLLTEAGTDALAQSIFKAFKTYKSQNNSTINLNKQPVSTPQTESKPQQAEKTATKTASKTTSQPSKAIKTGKATKTVFKIQILTSEKALGAKSKQFKGLSPVSHYREKGLYKYTYGESTDYNQILRTKKQISAKFKDAFIVAFKDGKKTDLSQAIKEFKNNKK